MLKIEITLDPTADSLDVHLKAIGFVRQQSPLTSTGDTGERPWWLSQLDPAHAGLKSRFSEPAPTAREKIEETAASILAEVGTEEAATPPAEAIPARVPGQPSFGRKRRTKEEIAEDEAHFAKHPEPVAEEAAESIFQAPVVDPADAAQDVADEARETAANKTGLTLDDVRQAVGAYQKAHGIAAAIKNIPEILGGPMHLIEDTQEAIAGAIRKLEIATHAPTVTSNPVVAAKIEEAKPEPAPVSGAPATKAGVVAALKRYALRFDGQDKDMSKAVFTQQDGKAILKTAIGVDTIAAMPDDPAVCARIIAAVDSAVMNNPYGREVKM